MGWERKRVRRSALGVHRSQTEGAKPFGRAPDIDFTPTRSADADTGCTILRGQPDKRDNALSPASDGASPYHDVPVPG